MKTMNDAKNTFTDYIKKNLIGPINDTFTSSNESELILERPLRQYFSGIIFPKLSYNLLHETEIHSEEDDIDDQDLDDEEEYDSQEKTEIWNKANENDGAEAITIPNDEDNFFKEELYPYSFGLSICLPDKVQSIKVRLKYGTYNKQAPSETIIPEQKISILEEDYNLIKNLKLENSEPLSGLIGYNKESNTVFLKRPISGDSGIDPSGDFEVFRELRNKIWQNKKAFKNDGNDSFDRLDRIDSVLQMLSPLYRQVWLRYQHIHEIEVSIKELKKTETYHYEQPFDSNNSIQCGLHAILISDPNEPTILKLLVENKTLHHSKTPFTKSLNEKCMFQAELEVESDHFIPMPALKLSPKASFEDMVVECQYRNTEVYAQAFNCACSWESVDSKVKLVKTDFMPKVIPPVTTNFFSPEFKNILNIYNNSIYSEVNNDELISDLNAFASLYKNWIDEQRTLSIQIEPGYSQAAATMLEHQLETLARMREGISILAKDDSILRLYRIANAAMLANMAIQKFRDAKFEPAKCKAYHYHAFQLTFLLINIPCMIYPESKIRENSIDLLWFPTGGGKTEAYLLLSAFTLLYRRFKHGDEGMGTSIIMRYTLRLLTSQQFERATQMILSLNFVCSSFAPELIASELFSSGLWIGSASSPNSLFDFENSANDLNEQIIEAKDLEGALRANKFPLSECPWCKTSLIELGRTGFNVLKSGFEIKCLNPACHFHNKLPIDLVDESLYKHPPSLLFATVDKFARLAWVPESAVFFGGKDRLPPELIIQDELHLISGPLGSITALFESIVELLCQNKGRKPRIVASTATIKNASSQVHALFGRRDIKTFPPPGINKDDNFFAKEDKSIQNREYVGIMPTGKTYITTQIKLLALILARRHKLIENQFKGIDNYWTVVAYYNSLRELGKMYAKTNDEIKLSYRHLVKKRNPNMKRAIYIKSKELTSRISGYEIKKVLSDLEKINVIQENPHDKHNSSIDLVFATNMISVGLDIERLNLIVLNGQPKNVSEYIQVTSRIARNHPGLIFTLYNPFKVRDRSHFENFVTFHQSYYRHVEPISVTPYTKVTISKMAPTLMAAYLRVVENIGKPSEIQISDLNRFEIFMKERINDPEMFSFLKNMLEEHLKNLSERLSIEPDLQFKDLLTSSSEASYLDDIEGDWITMNSMRDISPNSVIKITSTKSEMKKKRRGIYD